jgi:hypothetical protein
VSYFSQTDHCICVWTPVTYASIHIYIYCAGFVIHARFIPLADETPDGSDFRKHYVVVVRQSIGTCASVGIAALYVADKISQELFELRV